MAIKEVNETRVILAEGTSAKEEGTQSDERRAAVKIAKLFNHWGLEFKEPEIKHLENSSIKEKKEAENKEVQLKILGEIKCETISCKRNCHSRSQRLRKVSLKTEKENWGKKRKVKPEINRNLKGKMLGLVYPNTCTLQIPPWHHHKTNIQQSTNPPLKTQISMSRKQ